MDRVVIFVLAVAAGFAVLAGLWPLHVYLRPEFVLGADVAQRIDAEIGDLLAARDATLDVGHAECGPLLDLTNHRIARCTLPVSGVAISIEVGEQDGDQPSLVAGERLVVRSNAERRVAEALETRYGEPFTAHCLAPPISALPPRAPFTCAVAAADVTTTNIGVATYGLDGAVYPGVVAGASSREARVLGEGVTERREGGVAIDGAALARYLRSSAASGADGEVGRRGLLGPVHCPRRVVLTSRVHERCTIGIGDRTEAYDLRFDQGRGFVVEAEHTVVLVADVRDVATRFFERGNQSGGRPLRAVVDCGRSRVALLEPGASLRCTVTSDNATRHFLAQITDVAGTLTFTADDDG